MSKETRSLSDKERQRVKWSRREAFWSNDPSEQGDGCSFEYYDEVMKAWQNNL